MCCGRTDSERCGAGDGLRPELTLDVEGNDASVKDADEIGRRAGGGGGQPINRMRLLLCEWASMASAAGKGGCTRTDANEVSSRRREGLAGRKSSLRLSLLEPKLLGLLDVRLAEDGPATELSDVDVNGGGGGGMVRLKRLRLAFELELGVVVVGARDPNGKKGGVDASGEEP